MKKKILIFAVISIIVSSIFAQSKTTGLTPEKHEEKWSDMTYYTVPILKVLEAKDAYVILYLKNNSGTGTTVIPKSWAKGTPDNPKKLKFRDIKNPAAAYMTVVSKENSFYRVILTVPIRKNNNLWGVIEYSKQVPDTNKENLDDIVLN